MRIQQLILGAIVAMCTLMVVGSLAGLVVGPLAQRVQMQSNFLLGLYAILVDAATCAIALALLKIMERAATGPRKELLQSAFTIGVAYAIVAVGLSIARDVGSRAMFSLSSATKMSGIVPTLIVFGGVPLIIAFMVLGATRGQENR